MAAFNQQALSRYETQLTTANSYLDEAITSNDQNNIQQVKLALLIPVLGHLIEETSLQIDSTASFHDKIPLIQKVQQYQKLLSKYEQETQQTAPVATLAAAAAISPQLPEFSSFAAVGAGFNTAGASNIVSPSAAHQQQVRPPPPAASA